MAKKIGVVTMWDSQDNYGQVLQCYALQKFLTNCGTQAFLIKTKSDTLAPQSVSQRLIKLPSKILTSRFWQLLYFRYKLRTFNKKYGIVNRHFDEFRQTYIKSTEEIYEIEELKEKCPEADIYITGSDQVWGAPSELYFLNFVPNGKKKYSYAASFGNKNFSSVERLKIKEYLSRFDDITVRENYGVDLCKQLGISANRIMDPTGLLNKSDYMEITKNPDTDNYILVYLLGNYTRVNINDIYEYANRNNLEIKYIASQGRNDKYHKVFPTPSEWLGLVANAKYVITNSYHCCMFCMYFQKKFIALPLIGIFAKMNARMDTLFTQYNVPRIVSLQDLAITEFDYSEINSLLEKDREMAKDTLSNWIQN